MMISPHTNVLDLERDKCPPTSTLEISHSFAFIK